MTKKNKPFIGPLLLGGVLLLLGFLCKKDEEDQNCSVIPAAVIATNPNLERSYEIEKAKNRCIKERICSSDILMGSYPCEFTAYSLKECEDIDPALADYKTARRHLEAQVETCELRKVENRARAATK